MQASLKRIFAAAFALLFLAASAWASPTTSQQAVQVVQGWLNREATPLGAAMSPPATTAQTYDDANGQPAYYVVALSPQGFVVVPADDAVEPILAFSPDGQYDPAAGNPLYTLVGRDVGNRLALAREAAGKSAATAGLEASAQAKWSELLTAATAAPTVTVKGSLPSLSDTRVSPLTVTTWNQSTDANNVALYNIYTPNHYLTGCTATAMAQLMRFHQFPTGNVPVNRYSVEVNNVTQSMTIRGGDGSGGPYAWSSMTVSPNVNTPTNPNRQAISALMADAGASVGMSYTASSSGAWFSTTSFVNQFGYASARSGWSYPASMPTAAWTKMFNPNLDAGLPVNLAVFTSNLSSGHSIVCDGYGYESATMYHHMNVGWSGASNLWYNLPTIDTGYYTFSLINQTIYNLYPYGSAEIISGRIADASGNGISGARLTAALSSGGTSYTYTNYRGIYSIKNVPSGATATIHAAKPGYTFTDSQVTVGTSVDDAAVGNVWGGAADFTGAAAPLAGALTKLSTGGNHSLALAADGTVWAMGDNTYGQLGTGDVTAHARPVKVVGLPSGTPATEVAAGRNHSLVLLADGTVWAFGANTAGQLGTNQGMDATPHPTPTQLTSLTGIAGISAGASNSSLAHKSSGLWTWGQNDAGQLGLGDKLARNVPVLAVNAPAVPYVKGGVIGRDHTLCLMSDDKAYGFGDNSHGQLGTGNTTALTAKSLVVVGMGGVKQMAVGDSFSLILKTDGMVYGFGLNSLGQLGAGDVTGADQTQPVLIPGLSNVENIEAGDSFALVRKADGTVLAFGDNTAGQLGQGTTGGFSRVPVQMSGPSAIVWLAAGGSSGLAPSLAGNVWVVGDNSHGQLGTGDATARSTAAKIAFNLEAPSAGGSSQSGANLLLLQN